MTRERALKRTIVLAAVAVVVVIAAAMAALAAFVWGPRARAGEAMAARAALSVNVTHAQLTALPLRVSANGDIAAWQEASVGAEANGLRIAEVNVNVGDRVERGQVLAAFAPDTMQADVAQTLAAVAEAEASLAEASANAKRARALKSTGALSEASINQYDTAERTAKARLAAQRAVARMQRLRLKQTQVLAPDDGVISARSAAVGAVSPAGQELFRIIRGGRLEWRAQVAAADMAALQPGMLARVSTHNGPAIPGRVRMVGPTVDPRTRNGIVYVDLPNGDASPSEARAGMFAHGEFDVGVGSGLTLPQSAVQLRDGFGYVLRVGADSRLTELRVGVGSRVGDRIEITSGLDTSARVVAAGGSFLADGDTVRVIDAPPEAPGG